MELTADYNPSSGFHGSAVPVIRITRDVVHISGDIVDDGDHMPCDFLSDVSP